VDTSQRLSFLASGRPWEDKPRSEPDSGNPTVRDRRGASGDVDYGEGYLGTYRGNADTAKPLPTVARAGVLSRLHTSGDVGERGSARTRPSKGGPC
jgi:hypothetical protein